MVMDEDEIHGFLFGSLERIGGTPCVLWGLGATATVTEPGPVLAAMTTELYRRAAISFPDEDVLVAARRESATARTLMSASPRRATGSGTSAISNLSSPPCSRIRTAFIAAGS